MSSVNYKLDYKVFGASEGERGKTVNNCFFEAKSTKQRE